MPVLFCWGVVRAAHGVHKHHGHIVGVVGSKPAHETALRCIVQGVQEDHQQWHRDATPLEVVDVATTESGFESQSVGIQDPT